MASLPGTDQGQSGNPDPGTSRALSSRLSTGGPAPTGKVRVQGLQPPPSGSSPPVPASAEKGSVHALSQLADLLNETVYLTLLLLRIVEKPA